METANTDLTLDDVRAFLAVATLAPDKLHDHTVDDATRERLLAATEALCPEDPPPAPTWDPPAPPLALPGYLPPVSAEVRYSRSKGRYGRRRGDDDASMQKRPGWNLGAFVSLSLTREIRSPAFSGKPPLNQARSATGQLAGAWLRASAKGNAA